MDAVYLPILTDQDTVETALERMKTMDTRAVVIQYDFSDYLLYTNRDIVNAWKAHVKMCGDIDRSAGQPVSTMQKQLHVQPDSFLYNAFESMLDEDNTSFGLPFSPSTDLKFTAIVTRHEGIAADLQNAGKVCVCSGNDRHLGDQPPVNSGDGCTFCTGTYECY